MALGDIKARIQRTLKRPELADKVVDAINDAIEMISTLGDWTADLVEGTATISSSDYAQSLVISAEFDRFRKIKYLRPDGYTYYLNWKDPQKIFQKKTVAYGLETADVWYRAGDNIVFKLTVLSSSMLYGFYQYPARFELDADDDETNWYLDQMQAAVTALALSSIYNDIGNASEASRLEKKGIVLVELHKADKQDGVSHS